MEVERLCGIPKGTLNGIKFRQKTNPGIDATLYAPAILKSFSAISARWLLLGEDSMLEPGAFDHVTRGDKNFFKALLTALHERSRRMITSMEEFQDEITALINAI